MEIRFPGVCTLSAFPVSLFDCDKDRVLRQDTNGFVLKPATNDKAIEAFAICLKWKIDFKVLFN